MRTELDKLPATQTARYRLPFQVGDIPGYQVAAYTLAGPRESSAWITTPANIAAGFPAGPYDLHVFGQGHFDATAGHTGEPVQVNGRPGFYRDDMPCLCGSTGGVPSIGWEYAPESWALGRYQVRGYRSIPAKPF